MDDEHSIAMDVGEKFDAIFGKEEEMLQEVTAHIPEKEHVKGNSKTNKYENISITQQLKSIILSIEWDMKDDFLKQYNEILSQLHDKFKDDIIILGLTRILQFLGLYIQVKKNESDSRVGKMILNISEKLEWAIDSNPSEAEKRTVFADIVEQYRDWTNSTKDFTDTKPDEAQETSQEQDIPASKEHPLLPQDIFNEMINEIRETVRDEVKKVLSETR